MDFCAATSPKVMRLRFFFVRREVRSERLRFGQVDYHREMVFVALSCPDLSDPVLAGLEHAVCDPDNQRPGSALQVAAPWQGKGLGRLLLQEMLHHLRDRGTAEIMGPSLMKNEAMAGLARRLGFAVAALQNPACLCMAWR